MGKKNNIKACDVKCTVIEEKLPFISELSEEEHENLIFNSSIVILNKGSVFRSDFEEEEYFLFIISGRARIYLISENGKEITIDLLKEEDIFFSSKEYFNPDQMLMVFQAETDCEILKINTNEILRGPNHIELKHYFISELASSYMNLSRILMNIVSYKLETRVARLLLHENEEGIIHLTHSQIATYLNSTREQVSRILGDLESRALIDLGYRKVIITDFDGLEAFSKEDS